MSEFVCRVCFN